MDKFKEGQTVRIVKCGQGQPPGLKGLVAKINDASTFRKNFEGHFYRLDTKIFDKITTVNWLFLEEELAPVECKLKVSKVMI
jgi:hypothetical protein